MTVTATSSRVEYAGNGVTVAFTVPFYFLENADLKVYKDGTLQTITTHYTVSGAGNSAGGTVTFLSAPAVSQSIVIFRDPSMAQDADYVENDPFPAQSHERALDKLTMIAQRIRELVNRSFRLSDSDTTGASTIIPTPAAYKLIGWNSAGTELQNYDSSDIASAATYSNWLVQTFSGDGSTTTFTLTDSPMNVANTDVSIDGLTQVPGVDYTLGGSGLSLVFGTAPSNGSVVCCRYGQSASQGKDDASIIYYLPAGTGAVPRTVQSKLRDVVNIKDFGALGDGVADDTAVIQLAINSGAASVFFPAGTYKVSLLQLVSNQKLYGEGVTSIILATTATADADGGVFQSTSKSGIEVCDLKFQGINRPKNNNPNSQDGDRGISFQSCSNVNIHDCEVEGFWSFGIVCSGGSEIRITNNYVHDIGNQSCIAISNQVSQATVTGNICADGKLYGIEAENQTTKASIVGNSIRNCVAGIAVVNGGQHISVTGNNIFECNNTNTISGSSGIGLYYVGDLARPLYDIATTGNVVSDNDAYALIIVGGHQNLVFSGNTFQNRGSNTTGKLVEVALGTGTRRNVTFSGNIFDCFNVSNAFVADTISEYSFSSNDIYNPNGNVFTFLNVCNDNNFELPKILSGNIDNIPNQENLTGGLNNWFWSNDKSEQYVTINGAGNFERNIKSPRKEKLVGIYWCVNSNASTGSWLLKINGVNFGGLVPAVAGQEVWTFLPLNIITAAGSSNLIGVANTVGNVFGDYFKFRLVNI